MLDGYEFRERIVGQLAKHTQILEDMKSTIEKQVDPLWNEYQQQKGERRVIRFWLAALSIVVAVVTALHH